jgi:hypothetical protein
MRHQNMIENYPAEACDKAPTPSRLNEVRHGILYTEERLHSLDKRLNSLADRLLGPVPIGCAPTPGNLGKIEAEPPMVETLVRANTRVGNAIESCFEVLQRLESL